MPVCMTSGVLSVITPFSPKPALGVPSDALSEYMLPERTPKIIDAGALASPGQYAMPRFAGWSLLGS